jgi:FkbM family methyltransferase
MSAVVKSQSNSLVANILKKMPIRGRATVLAQFDKMFKIKSDLNIGDYRIPLNFQFKDELGWFFYESIPYEEGLKKILLKLTQGTSVFFDIGANMGYYSFLFKTQNPKGQAFAFEPNRYLADKMKAALSTSNNRFEVFNIGLGDKAGELTLSVSSDAHVTGNFRNGTTEGAGYKVPIETLDALLAKGAVKKPDVIKMDVEGFEMNVLMGFKSILEHQPILVMEWIESFALELGYSTADLFAFFGPDYKILSIGSQGQLLPYDSKSSERTNDLLVFHRSKTAHIEQKLGVVIAQIK